MCFGFCSVEVFPSPKFQFHEVGDPVLVSVKVTFNGAFPELGLQKSLRPGSTLLGTVKALMHTFVFGKFVVMSVQVFPSGLTKLSPAFAFALLLQREYGISMAIGKLYSGVVSFRTTENF